MNGPTFPKGPISVEGPSPHRLRDYVTRKALAKELGECLRGKPYAELTLINWERRGKGPPITRIGRDVLYYLPSVEKWLRAQEKGTYR